MSNPFENDEWGEVVIGGSPLPGVVILIDGAKRPYEWAEQKGFGIDGAALIYRGAGLVGPCKITCSLSEPSHFTAARALAKKLFVRVKGAKKPSAYKIEHPVFAWLEVARVVLTENAAPYKAGGNGWMIDFTVKEYRPRRTIQQGPPEPAKINEPPKPKDQAEQILGALLDKLEKA